MSGPLVVLEGFGAFAGQELHGRLEAADVSDQAVVRLPTGLGVYVWLEPSVWHLDSAGVQVGGWTRSGYRLTRGSVGLARCHLGLPPLPSHRCPCPACVRARLRAEAIPTA